MTSYWRLKIKRAKLELSRLIRQTKQLELKSKMLEEELQKARNDILEEYNPTKTDS